MATWLYFHNGEFWSPRNSGEVWEHLQYIYDEYVMHPHVGIDMRRRGTNWHPRIEILNWEEWFSRYRGHGRVSLAEKMNTIDEVLDDLQCDERVADSVADEEMSQMNQMMDEVMSELEVKAYKTV